MANSVHGIGVHNWVTLGLTLRCNLRLVLKLSIVPDSPELSPRGRSLDLGGLNCGAQWWEGAHLTPAWILTGVFPPNAPSSHLSLVADKHLLLKRMCPASSRQTKPSKKYFILIFSKFQIQQPDEQMRDRNDFHRTLNYPGIQIIRIKIKWDPPVPALVII